MQNKNGEAQSMAMSISNTAKFVADEQERLQKEDALRRSDEEARHLAVDVTRSYIVQAPAGSGKTSLLTQRFLKLLSVVDNPEEILAITFTNKAVGEMKERILACLKNAAENECPQGTQYERENWLLANAALKKDREKKWHLLSNPGRLRIRTIDSFCNYIAQNLPISSGMGYSLETDADSQKYYRQAAVNTINSLLHDVDEKYTNLALELKEILADYDNNQSHLEDALADMLEHRSDFVKIFDNMIPEESGNYASLYRENFDKIAENGDINEKNNWREKAEASYKKWRDRTINELEKVAKKVDYEFYEVVKLAARALICGRNAGCEDKIKQADKERQALVYALARLADCEVFAQKETLEPWEKWQLLSTVLLNSEKKGFRKKITAAMLYWNDNKDKLEGLKKTDKKAQYYQDWLNFIDDTSGLLKECDSYEQADEFIELLRCASDFGPARYSDAQWQKIAKTLHILAFATDNLYQVFAQEMKCDYAEISRAALRASDPSWEKGLDRFSIDNPIKHILVDEYQDTSWEQYQLLINLTCNWGYEEKRTIFCVGDPMQSIYRFRGADVSVYTYTKDVGICSDYNELKPSSCTLHQNFRSSLNLINELGNNVFKYIFPQSSCSEKGTVEFSPSIAPLGRGDSERPLIVEPIISLNSETKNKLKIKGFTWDENYEPSEYEAELIVAEITKLRDQEPEASCAVLLEQKNLGGHILQALQKKNIPVSQKDILKLQEAEPVPLLLAITKVFLNPLDRTSWIMILRSPLVGLTWQDICLISERYIIKDGDKIRYSCPGDFWSALHKFIRNKQGGADLLKRCRQLYSVFKLAFQERRSLSLGRSIEYLWRSLGGPAYYQEAELNNAKQYLDFLNRYNESSFWPTSESLNEDLNELYADTLSEITNPVQFLTIHGAKGLEFDYVFIPGLGKKKNRIDKNALLENVSVVYDDSQVATGIDNMLLSYSKDDTPEGRTISYIKKSFDKKEKVRLFYVAATRAKKRLFIYTYVKFTLDKNNNFSTIRPLNKEKILDEQLFGQLGKFFPEYLSKLATEFASIELCQIYMEKYRKVVESLNNAENLGNNIPRLILDWRQECGLETELTPNYMGNNCVYSAQDNERTSRKVSDHSVKAQLGTIIHYAFEHLAQYPQIKNENWDTEDVLNAFKPVIKKLCAEQFNGQQCEEVTERAYLAVSQLLNSVKGRWILQNRAKSCCELAFYAHRNILNEVCLEEEKSDTSFNVEKRILDRCFVEGDTFWIIDYKTSCLLEGQTIAEFYRHKAETYKAQLMAYKRIVAECFPQYKDKIRTALYFPLALDGEAFCEVIDD